MLESTHRRSFLRNGLLVASGAAAGAWLPRVIELVMEPAVAAAGTDSGGGDSGPEQRLRELGLELPPAPAPVAVYVPAVAIGNLLFVSGHGPRTADGTLLSGRVGRDLTLEQGAAAARLVGLNVLSTVRATLGTLDRVTRLVKVLGMVYCDPGFEQHPQVINGFSELMVQVFGEQAGKGARSAVGMGSLPSNIPVEIEAIFEIRS